MTGIHTGTGSQMALQAMLGRVNSLGRQGAQGAHAIGQIGETFTDLRRERDRRRNVARQQDIDERAVGQGDRRLDMAEGRDAQAELRQREQSVIDGQNRMRELDQDKANRAAIPALAQLAGVQGDLDPSIGRADPSIVGGVLSRVAGRKQAEPVAPPDPGLVAMWDKVNPGVPMPTDMKSSTLLDYIERDDTLSQAGKDAKADGALIAGMRANFPDLGIPDTVQNLEQLKAYQSTWSTLGAAERQKRVDALAAAKSWLDTQISLRREGRATTAEGRAVAGEGRAAEAHTKRMDASPERVAILQSVGPLLMGPIMTKIKAEGGLKNMSIEALGKIIQETIGGLTEPKAGVAQ